MRRDLTDNLDADEAAIPEGISRPEYEAMQWVVRMNAGDVGLAEQTEFGQWCERSAENRAALAAAYQLWLDTGPALRAAAPRRAAARRLWPALALAASLLVLVTLGARTLLDRHQPAGAITELADAGGYCRLLLGDGAASFDVTPNPELKGADAEETQVRIMDAAFSLKPYARGVLVTVTGGQVQYNDGKDVRVFSAGQRLSCNAGQPAVAQRNRTPGRAADAVAELLRGAAAALSESAPLLALPHHPALRRERI